MPEALITGQQQYMESLMGTAGPSVLTEEQITNISAAQHSNTARATIKGQTDRRWEVWGPVAKGSGANEQGKISFKVESNMIAFYNDNVMSYPQLIVWALEMRRMMDVSVPEGVIRPLEETRVAQQTQGPLRRQLHSGGSSCRSRSNHRIG